MRRAISSQRGCTLVEVLIATVLIAVALTGLSQLLIVAMSQVQDARHRSMATWLAAAKLEQLQALNWSVRIVGTVPVLLQDEVTDLTMEPAGTTGLGTRAGEGVDYLDARGVWVGRGGAPPGMAIYERRWSIARRGSGASELLVFRVGVADLPRQRRLRSADWRGSPHVVWLFGARLRRASE